MSRFIANLPKAELHVHIEGTLEAEMMFLKAERNRVPLPYDSLEELVAAYNFRNQQTFLDIFYEGIAVLRHERDFYDLTLAYLKKASAQNVRHAEMFFDPQAHVERGIWFETVLSGISRAQRDARREYGISSHLIMCVQRHRSAAAAMDCVKLALPFKQEIIGIGLDSSERDHPPRKFADVFQFARQEGFRIVAHAGEDGPAENIWQALDVLIAERIDHGISCLSDDTLVKRLRMEKVPLTVCPLSNVKMRVFETMANHNIRQLLAAGLHVTINSDYPAYCGGYINENYQAAQDALNLSDAELYQIASSSIAAAFLSQEEKERLFIELEAHARASHLLIRSDSADPASNDFKGARLSRF